MERLIKNKLFRIFAAVVVILFIGTAIFSVLTPQPLPAENVIQTEKTFTPTITILESENVELPTEANVYKLTVYQSYDSELLTQLIEILNLEPNEVVENYWQNSEDTIILSNDPDENLIKLNYLRSGSPEVQDNRDDGIPLLAAQTFITPLSVFAETTPKVSDYFVKGASDIVSVPKGQAHGAVIEYYQQLDGRNVYFYDKQHPLAKLWIDFLGDIHQVEFVPEKYQFDQIATLPVLRYEQITEHINQGKGIYLSTSQTNPTLPNPEKLLTIEIKPIAIEYRAEPDTGTTIPYLRFQGIGYDDTNTQVLVELVVPIVATTY